MKAFVVVLKEKRAGGRKWVCKAAVFAEDEEHARNIGLILSMFDPVLTTAEVTEIEPDCGVVVSRC
jgi:hypothetical protein